MQRPDPRPRASTPAEAEAIVRDAIDALANLTPLIDDETRLLGAGDLRAALALGEEKAAASRRYTLALEAVKANAIALGRFRPPSLTRLRDVHEAFSRQIAVNMAVLETTRTVSESLIRELAESVGNAQRPQAYGRPGSRPGGYRTPAAALVVSKSA
jgi:hypothetical protein